MSESTTVLVKKKEKKKQPEQIMLTIQEAIAILRPFVVKWKRLDKDMANKMYEIYKQCKWGDWSKVLEGLNFPKSTWQGWTVHFGFKTNFPQTNDTKKGSESTAFESETETEFEDIPEEAYAADQYDDIYRILDEAQHLSVKRFSKAEKKEELIEKLQKTISKLNGLLVRLESNI